VRETARTARLWHFAFRGRPLRFGGMPLTILFFVKHPAPGRVKTRLAASVGAAEACAIYQTLVSTVCERLPRNGKIVVLFDPPEQRSAIVQWLSESLPGTPEFSAQVTGDLGQRLNSAFAAAFSKGDGPIAVIGSDCVEISRETFTDTSQALETHDVVLGPTHDGGYYLLALNRPCSVLFENIPWSTEGVAAATLRQARAVGLCVFLLPSLHDVDTEEDWKRALPRTASAPAVSSKPSLPPCN
jgi:rSAM/selenodomain-associated transferase 1